MTHPAMKQARLLAAGAAVAPVLAVGFIRFAGPQTVAAATWSDESYQQTAPEAFSLPGEREVPAVVAAATTHARRLLEIGISATPFPERTTDPDDPETPADQTWIDPTPLLGAPEPPPIQLSAIMSRRAGAIAVIDARIRTIGSKIADAWVLEAVDEQARTITIRHRSGHLVTVELESP